MMPVFSKFKDNYDYPFYMVQNKLLELFFQNEFLYGGLWVVSSEMNNMRNPIRHWIVLDYPVFSVKIPNTGPIVWEV